MTYYIKNGKTDLFGYVFRGNTSRFCISLFNILNGIKYC